MWGYIGSARQDTTMTTTTIGTKIVCRITIWLQETSEKAASFFAIAFAYYLRAVIRDRLQREENRRWYDAIDQRWREREARERAAEPERRRIMAEGVRRDMESMDRSNSRPAPGSLASLRAADRAGGNAGFKIR